MPETPTHHIQLMHRALDLARHAATLGEVPVGAVVYRLDTHTIIAEAHNRRELDQDPTAHAEVLALRQAAAKLNSWRLIDHGLAVTLEPCPMCAGALVNARIDELLYGATDPMMGCVDTLHQLCTEPRFNHRMPVHAGILADESAQLLRSFFAERRGKHKPPKPNPHTTL
ncbi:MAG: tRNA adenosine(34) deaminase TadA [Planctomycetota bacterium]